MADRFSYEPILSAKATASLVGLSKTRQRKWIKLLFQLADNPSQIGDYSEPDETGPEEQFILVRDLLVAFCADPALRSATGFFNGLHPESIFLATIPNP